ncbi:hypothetical protein JW872_00655 [Candidatus Babeliales bacterium]|nr:hypothetical protein [Candidatus Babeliales bacterium]
MIQNFFSKMSPTNQGNMMIAAGAVLLLYALDLIRGLNIIIVLVAAGMIWYGITMAGYDKKIQRLISRS